MRPLHWVAYMMNVINIGFGAGWGNTVADETLGQKQIALPR